MSRTPSVEAHDKVLEAAIRLFGERGIDGASMDAIAAESGVSKATVYKHWKDKDALCLDVINSLRVAPPESTGDPRRDLVNLLSHVAQSGKPGRLLKILPQFIGYAAANPEFGEAFRKCTTGPTEIEVSRIVRGAIESGRLSKETDPEIALSLLFGPILHRRIMGGSIPPKLVGQIVDSFWRSWGVPSSTP